MTGDQFADGLLAIAKEIQGLQELPRKVAELGAPKIDKLIDQELQAGTGPQGSPWEPLKDGSGRIPFSSSDRMRKQITVSPEGLNIRGKLLAPWNIHQFGSRNPRKSVPARKVYQKNDLAPSWKNALEEAEAEALKELTPKLRAAGK